MFSTIPYWFAGVTLNMCTTIRWLIVYFINLTLFNTFLLLKWIIFIFSTILSYWRAFNLNNIPFLPKRTIFLHTLTCSIIKNWILEWTLLTYLLCLIPKRSFLRAKLAWVSIRVPYGLNIITYFSYDHFRLTFIKLSIVVLLLSTFVCTLAQWDIPICFLRAFFAKQIFIIPMWSRISAFLYWFTLLCCSIQNSSSWAVQYTLLLCWIPVSTLWTIDTAWIDFAVIRLAFWA